MGVNAQTTVPKFTAGQVLTAAQQTGINTGIPVFATTTTRDAAFGGSNKVLAEGQFAYIEASNTTQYYDGAAWQTLVKSGLDIVVAETTFTSASSVSVNNCFTSSYTNYLLIVNCTASSNQTALRMRVSGTDSTTGYYWANWNYDSNNTGTSVSNNVNSSSNVIGADEFYCAVTIYSPQLAQKTIFDAHGVRWLTGRADAWFTNGRGGHDVATAYDGFTLFPFSGTMTGRYTLYGYGKS